MQPRFIGWVPVGTHSFLPTDRATEIGSFDLSPGQDTIWVKITQLNDPAQWPWSYGILSWRNSEGVPLGSVKAYSNRLGEVFRLGNGLAPLVGTGSLWFEPRGFNLGWLKAGFPWELSFEAQAGAGDVTSGYWNRDPNNGLITPRTQGDNLDMGTGWIKAKNLILTDNAGGSDDRSVPGYQQGLWIPTLVLGTNTNNPGDNVWFRVGNAVTLTGLLNDWSDITSASAFAVTGLPYSFAVNQAGGSVMASRIGVPVHSTYLTTSESSIRFYASAINKTASWSQLLHSDTSADTLIRFTATYLTDNTDWKPSNNATVTQ